MASSVSIERASSSAGITIGKHHSRLRLDIVGTLQFMKCTYRRELLFHHEPSTALEAAEELFHFFEGISDAVRGERGAEGESGWGGLVGDPQDNAGVQGVVKLVLMMFSFRLLCRDTFDQFLL